MRTRLLIPFVLMPVSACNGHPHYRNAAEFEAVVESWQLNGKHVNEAISVLTMHNFKCKERTCYLEVFAFPCQQKQKIHLVVNNEGKVTKTSIWKLQDDQLPSACL